MKKSLVRGLLISIEGADCTGKSTISRQLIERLTNLGYEVENVADLYTTKLGEEVHRLFLSHNSTLDPMTEALLIFSARVELIQKHIVPAIRAGKIVIADRFTDSTFVYQGMVKEVGENTIALLETLCQSTLRPDHTILAICDVDKIMDRLAIKKNKDKHELLGQEFHEQVMNGFAKRLMTNRARFTTISTNTNVKDTCEQLESFITYIDQSLIPYVKSIDSPVSTAKANNGSAQ